MQQAVLHTMHEYMYACIVAYTGTQNVRKIMKLECKSVEPDAYV